MSCCEESDGNLTECPGDELEYHQYQDSAHSQILLLSLIISLWIFSIAQFLRSDSGPELVRPSKAFLYREYSEWLLPEPFCESFNQMLAFHEVRILKDYTRSLDYQMSKRMKKTSRYSDHGCFPV